LLAIRVPYRVENLVISDRLNSKNSSSKRKDNKYEGGLRTKGFVGKRRSDIPLLSIITVVFNGADFIEETILSVARQDYDNIEYLIIDGGSNDRTLEIICSYQHVIDYYISEPDTGIYNAMNKGLKKCSGDYVWFMNAGDSLFSETVVSELFAAQPFRSYYFGNTMLIGLDGRESKLSIAPKVLSVRSLARGMVVSHQSFIVSIKYACLFDETIKYVSDLKWVIDVVKKCGDSVNTDQILSKYRLGGLSERNANKCVIEKMRVIRSYVSLPMYIYLTLLFSLDVAKNLLRSLYRKW
jgi:glycosyltransferase involved in cell wall biosynthesis